MENPNESQDISEDFEEDYFESNKIERTYIDDMWDIPGYEGEIEDADRPDFSDYLKRTADPHKDAVDWGLMPEPKDKTKGSNKRSSQMQLSKPLLPNEQPMFNHNKTSIIYNVPITYSFKQ